MAKQHTLNVSLTPQLAKMVADLVDSGRYASASEVVREGLRVLEEERRARREDLRRVRRLIDAGIADSKAGRVEPAARAMADLRSGLGRRRKKRAA